jgi:hypothetical protein
MLNFKDKSGLAFSRAGISYEEAPDVYSENGFDHLFFYVSKLITPSKDYKSLIISTPKEDRVLSLSSKNGIINVGFIILEKPVDCGFIAQDIGFTVL